MRYSRNFVLSLLAIAGVNACGSEAEDPAGTVDSALTVDTAATYTLVGVGSNKCVTVAGGGTANLAALQIATCSGAASQQFRLTATSGGYYSIANVGSGKCVDVTGASTLDGAALVQYSCSGGTNQQWLPEDVATGTIRLTARHSGKVMDVTGRSTADGSTLIQWGWSGAANQQFRLVKVGGATGAGGTTGTGGTTAGTARCSPAAATGHYQMEDLDRGLIAARSGNGNYVGWRMLGYEYDAAKPSAVIYRLYRNGTRIADVTDSTNYYDAGAAATVRYSVRLVVDGVECPSVSKEVTPLAEPVLTIPVTPPPAGTSPNGESYAYDVGTVTRSVGNINDGSPGDVDGDGDYEIITAWAPSNSRDNSQGGFTGPVYVDAYDLTGRRLWRLNLGPNVRAGAHYNEVLVYDLDGDGRSEVVLKTAPGSRDSTGAYLRTGPAATDDDSKDYRNSGGWVLSGPEYLTVFDGATGKELSTINLAVGRGDVCSWGDCYGNRVDRFLSSIAFVDDTGALTQGSGRPAVLIGRGYYTRATVTAYTWRGGKFAPLWTYDSGTSTSETQSAWGQGAHSMMVADVDGDRSQEIIYGSAMIQSNGKFGCSTGFGHGDALHVGDFVPTRPGLEVFMPHESVTKPSWSLRSAGTCEVLRRGAVTGADTGRGVADDVNPNSPGGEFWSAGGSELFNATSGASVGPSPSQLNFLVWFDADESRELLDGGIINKYDGARVLTCTNCTSNNYTKATPVLTADLFGDWREEVVWRSPTSNQLRIYTTTAVTKRRLFTLMHDPQYRMNVSSEQTGYNQPPHPSFHIGSGMAAPPAPSIYVR